MIQRFVATELQHRLKASPAVALVGPRQCGKTTLAWSLGGNYFDLEQPADRVKLDLQWDQLTAGNTLIILDEAQSWPEVFPRLRGAIDKDRKRTGRFLLLGSVSPTLMVKVSESLAGRLALLELTPFLLKEIPADHQQRLWLCGGFPDGGVLGQNRFPRWQDDYLTLLAERDLPNWGLTARPQTTTRFLKMLAALHGQPWNASQLGSSLSLDGKTVSSYLDYLTGAFLIRRLLPYQGNIRKRLVKRPKVYWRDTGLLHAQLNITTVDALLSHPAVGASWEGFVIEQIIGSLSASGRRFEPYFFGTSDQHEIDLVIESEGEIWAFEVKLTASPNPGDMAKLKKNAEMVGAKRVYLVSNVTESSGDDRIASCNLADVLTRLSP
jgi:predicted AAA+ superfamily ATPase